MFQVEHGILEKLTPETSLIMLLHCQRLQICLGRDNFN